MVISRQPTSEQCQLLSFINTECQEQRTLPSTVEPDPVITYPASYTPPYPYLSPPSPFPGSSRTRVSGQQGLAMPHPCKTVYCRSPSLCEQLQGPAQYRQVAVPSWRSSIGTTVNNICLFSAISRGKRPDVCAKKTYNLRCSLRLRA